MNEIIARSKLKWYVNPMMVLSIAIVVGLVFDLATGAEFKHLSCCRFARC